MGGGWRAQQDFKHSRGPWLTGLRRCLPRHRPAGCAGVCDARVDRIAHTAEHTTHFSLCCAGCGGAVGRLYTEVPPALAPVCNLFCLEVSSCLSYELGSAEVRAPGGGCAPAVAQQQQQQQVGGPQLPGAGGDATLVLELLARVEHLEASLCTVRGMRGTRHTAPCSLLLAPAPCTHCSLAGNAPLLSLSAACVHRAAARHAGAA